MKFRTIKGTHDILPEEAKKWQWLEDIVRQTFESWGFEEIRTPILEEAGLFEKSLGADSDVVQKEMYMFEDRDGKIVVLRPEGTAPVVRAYIQHGLHTYDSFLKVYYIGPMFRRERPQAGRLRQFHQFGAEIIGDEGPASDALTIALAFSLLKKLGLKNFKLIINSVGCPKCRTAIKDTIVNYFRPLINNMCDDCRRRFQINPLRILDCKNETCRTYIEKAPGTLHSLCEECRTHFDKLKETLQKFEIPFEIEPHLVRGLDYYTKTAFEFVHQELNLTILAGGRYDQLIEQMGGKPTPALGFAAGTERILMALDLEKAEFKKDAHLIYVIPLNGFVSKAWNVFQKLTESGVKAEFDVRAKSLKAKMRRANNKNSKWVVFVSEKIELKNMQTGEQKTLNFEELLKILSKNK